MGTGNKHLYKWSRSHDQDGHHVHMVKNMKNSSSLDQKADDLESLYAALGTRVPPNLFK